MTGWIVLGAVVWPAASLAVAVLVGGVVARRDRQVPLPDAPPPVDAVPRPRGAGGGGAGGGGFRDDAGRSAPAPRR